MRSRSFCSLCPSVLLAALGACAPIDARLSCEEQGDCPDGESCLDHACKAPTPSHLDDSTHGRHDIDGNEGEGDVLPEGAAPVITLLAPEVTTYVDQSVSLPFSVSDDDDTAGSLVVTATASFGTVTLAGTAARWSGDGIGVDDVAATVTLTVTDPAGHTGTAQGVVHVEQQADCFRIAARGFSFGNGTYRILDEAAHALVEVTCDMDAGGFTQVATVVANDARWFYEGAAWTDESAFTTAGGLSAKSAAFLFVDVEDLLLDVSMNAVDQRIAMTLPSGAQPSTRSLFTSGARIDMDNTNAQRDAWISAFGSPVTVQDDACGAGLNQDFSVAAVRIGVVGDNGGGSCDSPNSWVGLGGGGSFFVDDTIRIASGNRCERPGDATCDLTLPATGDIYVRSRDLTDVGTFESCADARAHGWQTLGARFAIGADLKVCAD